MQAKIYLDVQFLTEWVLNLCVVLLTARIVGTGVRFARAALAAAAGALAHVALLAAGVLSGWHFCGGAMPVLGWLLIPVMTGIAFPGKRGRHRSLADRLQLWITFAAAAFLLSGLLQALHPFWQRMFFRFWLAVFAAYAVLQAGCKLFAAAKHRQMDLCPVRLYIGDTQWRVMALRDPGNRLQDPWLHRPVSILEEGALPFSVEELLGKSLAETLKVHMIPYSSVGCPSGVLTGLVFTRMVIEGTDGEQVIQAPVIGISRGTVSTEKAYQMILHEKFRQ